MSDIDINDNVVGFSGTPLEKDPVPVGGTYVRNEVVTNSFKGKKPATVGCYDPGDYGAVGDNVTDDTAAFQAMFNAINDESGGITDSRGARILLRERATYYFSESLIIDRSMTLEGAGGVSLFSASSTKLRFAAGKGVWFRARGNDKPNGTGASLRDVRLELQNVSGVIRDYAHDTIFAVGDLMRFFHDREFLWEVVRVTGDAKTSPALSLSGANSVWAPNTAYTVGDVVVPTPTKQNGHKYRCVQSGISGGAEPDLAIYGGWDWMGKALITDGTVVWEEAGLYLPDHGYLAMQPFVDAQHPDVKWAAQRHYEHNSIVRVDGVWDKVLWNGSEAGGTSGTSPPSLTGAVGTKIKDGGITWTIQSSSNFFWVDNNVTFQPRLHPGVSMQSHGRLERVYISGATCDGININTSGSGVPSFNTNFWQLIQVYFQDLKGGAVNVRGTDANGGLAIGCQAYNAGPITQVQGAPANHAWRDYSLAGSTWVGCCTFHWYGLAHDFYGDTQRNSIIGGYCEGGRSRLNNGTTVIGCPGLVYTRDSFGVDPGRGKGIYGQDENVANAAQFLNCYIAGSNPVDVDLSGKMALAIQATRRNESGEGNPHGPTWKNVNRPPLKEENWTTGWWGWTFGPGVYGGKYSAFAWSGDLAGAWKNLTSAGMFAVPRKLIGFGYPVAGGPPHALGYADDKPTANTHTWAKGDVLFDPTEDQIVGWRCDVDGTPGTWRAFGRTIGAIDKVSASTIIWKDDAFSDSSALVPKTYVLKRRRDAQTTTNAANQIIDDGLSFGGEDFSIPDNATVTIESTVELKKAGAAEGGRLTIVGTFCRAGVELVRIGTDDTTNKLSVGLAGTTLNYNINGNAVELCISPSVNVTINEGIARIHYVRLD